MWLSEQKPAMFAYKLKFILLPQLIATLNNYACLLPPLANVNWSAFPECFFWPCKSMTGEMAPMEGFSLAVGTLPHVCLGLVVEYWPFVGACGHHSHSKLYHYVILLSLCHHPPPYIHWPNINFHEKIHQKLMKISHFLLARLVVQKLIDN